MYFPFFQNPGSIPNPYISNFLGFPCLPLQGVQEHTKELPPAAKEEVEEQLPNEEEQATVADEPPAEGAGAGEGGEVGLSCLLCVCRVVAAVGSKLVGCNEHLEGAPCLMCVLSGVFQAW